MKIAQSNVAMESARNYSKLEIGKTDPDSLSFGELAKKFMTEKEDGYERSGPDNKGMYMYSKSGNLGNAVISDTTKCTYSSKEDQDIGMQYDLLYLLLRRLVHGRVFGRLAQNYGITQQYDTMSTQRLVTCAEYESTEFHAKGQAMTEDGRRIDFNIDVLMSRSYMEYMDVLVPLATDSLMDPLVINVGSGVTGISDQTFSFDLDADGKKEELAQLGSGSGFLAIDLNEDGKINDGSELFGTRSGDGFGDLRKYDLDGNGWIDENDKVFEKLKVWCRDSSGKDILMDLKEADVGAIFLGEAAGDFALKGDDNRTKGMIRSTGFFLKESLGIGTVQHVDLAVV